ncbi:MAG: low molecular weight protein-tyrosine-phosphatase [Sphingomonadales bacterium]
MKPTSVLFVCLGNICRSPMAEGIFRKLAADAGLDGLIRIDSAGTGDWHLGEQPDKRAIAEAARHGIDITGLRARRVRADDFRDFDHILAMDRSNLAALQRMAPPDRVRPALLLRYAPAAGRLDVPDPYRVGGFDEVFDLIGQGAAGLLHALRDEARGTL